MKAGVSSLRPADLLAIHQMYKDWGQLDDGIATLPDLFRYHRDQVADAVKVVHRRIIVGAVWLDHIFPGYYATMNLVRNKRRPAGEFGHYCNEVLDYFFSKYDLEKIVGMTWRREALLFARCFGFQVDGVLRHHAMVEGEWRDFKITSILREEFYGQIRGPRTSAAGAATSSGATP